MKNKYLLLADATSPHTLKWAKELVKYFDVYLVSLNGYTNEIHSLLGNEHIYSLNDSVDARGGNLKLILKYFDIIRIVKDLKPSYINAHYLSSYGVLAALVKMKYSDIKLIQSTWGTDVLVAPFENSIKFSIAKFALSKADVITSDSYFMTDKINEIYKNNITQTFPFGLEPFEIQEKISKDEFLIFSNRMLSENYNIDNVVEWFSKLENKKYRLVIANNGEMKSSLEALVKKFSIEDRVEFVGFLTNKEQNVYYEKAKYYISIPSSDSTAVSLLEAMKYGCHPIVSNLSANREWILDGVNGSYFVKELQCPKNECDVVMINQKIILSRAIFEKSIKLYVDEVKSLCK
jgi:glycosyltransferase involved in cell wall biosynthesis